MKYNCEFLWIDLESDISRFLARCSEKAPFIRENLLPAHDHQQLSYHDGKYQSSAEHGDQLAQTLRQLRMLLQEGMCEAHAQPMQQGRP